MAVQELEPGRAVEPPPPGLARLVFYRTAEMIGALVKPRVIIDGQKTGRAVRKTAWWVDLPPGDHQVSLSTEVKRAARVTLTAGQVAFVRTRPKTGVFLVRFEPEMVPPEEAEAELAGLGVHVSLG